MKKPSRAATLCLILAGSFLLLTCQNALVDKVKKTQEVAASSKIAIVRDTTPIASGATLDWGLVVPGAAAAEVVLSISNSGSADLILDLAKIAIAEATGTEKGLFTIGTKPDSTVTAGKSTALKLSFATLTLGAKSATLTIPTNDVLVPIFTIALAATGQNSGKVATPSFTPEGSTYGTDITVSIASATKGAAIHYSLSTSGTPDDPTNASALFDPAKPIDLTGNGSNTSIKAIAVKLGMDD
ncbi:MAG: chitobiase/beta-hexosaminidase C-terminal domain-containing protein [Spirochaetota bacterium]